MKNKDSKTRLFEVMSRLDKTFKPVLNKEIKEVNNTSNIIDPNYTHFAVLKNDKIVNGWDYKEINPEELKQFKKDYFFTDITEMGIDPKTVGIYTKRTLENKGINPFDSNNWNTDVNEELDYSKIAREKYGLQNWNDLNDEDKQNVIEKIKQSLKHQEFVKNNFGVNEETPEQNQDFLEITAPVGSEDDKLFVGVVNQGIDSHLEGFVKSKFDVKKGSLSNRRVFNFHKSELPILLRRLDDVGTEEALQWKTDIENYDENLNEMIG